MSSKMFVLGLLFLGVFTFAGASQALTWKAVFIAGDDSIENFDNGREDLSQLFSKLGQIQDIQMSSSRKFVSAEKSVYPATFENISLAFNELKVKSNEACLVHMTSHGAKGQGFYLSLSGILAPRDFTSLVNEACGEAPTVVLVSACYSGQFITEGIKGPNRVILTAARADRPSFGCSADTEYTYWDGCLLQEIPRSKTWVELYEKVNACISAKESVLGVKPSEPQAYFGENTKSWKLFQ